MTGYLMRARAAGVGWPVPAAMDDADPEARSIAAPRTVAAARPPPGFGAAHAELRRKAPNGR